MTIVVTLGTLVSTNLTLDYFREQFQQPNFQDLSHSQLVLKLDCYSPNKSNLDSNFIFLWNLYSPARFECFISSFSSIGLARYFHPKQPPITTCTH